MRTLTGVEKWSYAIGNMPYSVKDAAFIHFVVFYYTQVQGLSGTLAGLALGLKALGGHARAIGIPVCDDAPTFRRIVLRIADEAAERFGLPRLAAEDFTLLDGYQGRGYARSAPEELALLRETARLDGLVLDPVYTVKAFRGLLERAGRAELPGPRVVFVHTGGIFGLGVAGAALYGPVVPVSGSGKPVDAGTP